MKEIIFSSVLGLLAITVGKNILSKDLFLVCHFIIEVPWHISCQHSRCRNNMAFQTITTSSFDTIRLPVQSGFGHDIHIFVEIYVRSVSMLNSIRKTHD